MKHGGCKQYGGIFHDLKVLGFMGNKDIRCQESFMNKNNEITGEIQGCLPEDSYYGFIFQ